LPPAAAQQHRYSGQSLEPRSFSSSDSAEASGRVENRAPGMSQGVIIICCRRKYGHLTADFRKSIVTTSVVSEFGSYCERLLKQTSSLLQILI
jgi:hypothetical protein